MASDTQAHQYHQIKNILFFVNLATDVFLLLLFFMSGASLYVRDLCLSLHENIYVVRTLFFCICGLLLLIIHLPISYYSGYILEHKYSLSNQTFGKWFADEIKKSVLGFLFMILFLHGLYVLLAKYEVTWWIWAGGFWLILSFVLAKLTPNVIIPLFYKYSKVNDEGLCLRIKKMFEENHVALKDVYAINMSSKTKKANAFLCGVGKNRRVVLGDTLLEQFSHDEIEVVIAHELGHFVHKDIWKMLCVNTATLLIGFYFVNIYLQSNLSAYGMSGISDLAFLPMIALALTVFGFFIAPVLNGFSRMIERRADAYSLRITEKPSAFISLMEKLGKINLSIEQPPALEEIFFYDHPSIFKRIAFAKSQLGSE